MDPQNIGIIVFLILLTLLLIWKRKAITLQPILFLTAKGQMFWIIIGLVFIGIGVYTGIRWESFLTVFGSGDGGLVANQNFTKESLFTNSLLLAGALVIVFAVLKKEWVVQEHKIPIIYAVLYKTQKGISLMERIAKRFPRLTFYFGYLGIIVGFIGMVFIGWAMLDNVIKLLTSPQTAPGVGIVLPIQVKGAFFVPFFYWIISIFIIATVHEFCHGILARRHDIKVKSGGFLFLSIIAPVIPAAFVEPDEEIMKKRKTSQQLSVFAAGPMSNVVLAFICLGLLIALANPITSHIMEEKGVKVTGLIDGNYSGPAELAGLKKNTIITAIDDHPTITVANFSESLKNYQPGAIVNVKSDAGEFRVTLGTNPNNVSIPYMGVFVAQHSEILGPVKQKFGDVLPFVPIWFLTLLYWLWVLNLGIGLFNLVPLGPIDGGRMLDAALKHYFKEERANKVKKVVSIIMLGLILFNVGYGFFV